MNTFKIYSCVFLVIIFSVLLSLTFYEIIPQNSEASCLAIIAIILCTAIAQDEITKTTNETICTLKPDRTYSILSNPILQESPEIYPPKNTSKYISILVELDKNGFEKPGSKKLYRIPNTLSNYDIFTIFETHIDELLNIKVTVIE